MRSRLLAEMMGQALLRGMLEMFSAPREQQEIEQALESFLELMCGVVGHEKETADGMDNAG